MSLWTPKNLEGKVQEWREKRAEKLAHRLQFNSNKKRTVSGQVLGIPTYMGGKTTVVQLPTPPLAQYATDWRSAGDSMRKSLSYGDVHRRSIYESDSSNRGNQFGDSRHDEQTHHSRYRQHQQSGCFTPVHSKQRDYQSHKRSHSEPRKSFSSHSNKNNCKPMGSAPRHQQTAYIQPFIPNKTKNLCQPKYEPKSVLQNKINETKKPEKSVHFQDEMEESVSTTEDDQTEQFSKCDDPCPIDDSLNSEETENKLNSTFLVEDTESSDAVKLEASNPVKDVNQSSILDSVQTVETIEVITTSFREQPIEPEMGVENATNSPRIGVEDIEHCNIPVNPHDASYTIIPQILETCFEEPENASTFSLTLDLESTEDGETEISEVMKGDEESHADEENVQPNHGTLLHCMQTTPLKEELPLEVKTPMKNNVEDNLTKKLDDMFLTPMKSARKSRALLDSTNIVESTCIRFLEVKKKDGQNEIHLTPVRRSTRNKTNQEQVSEETLSKAKVVPNRFLNA